MYNNIKIVGARENNLKNISLTIPKHKITVFTGVSGAGKSSLVFNTIASESQRQLNAAFTNYLPLTGRPDADSIQNLTASAVIDQKQIRGNKRSTIGTVTEIHSLLRLLFSRIGEPHIGFSNAFSFNEPEGMCPECKGLGEKISLDAEALLIKHKSLNNGAIKIPHLNYQWQRYASAGLFDGSKKLSDYSDSEWQLLLYGDETHPLLEEINNPYLRHYHGLIDTFNNRYIKKDISGLGESTRQAIEQVTKLENCPLCKGSRLNQKALSSKINGKNIADFASLEVDQLAKLLIEIDLPEGKPIISAIRDSLEYLSALGLNYLTFDRPTSTLSAGEAQRIKMVRHLGSSLTDLTYIFDEPSIGLHPRDVQGLNKILKAFRDNGNTVLIVEHDPDIIAIADHIVDLGPGAGKDGGQICYQGTFEGLLKSNTLTGKYLQYRKQIKPNFRTPTGKIRLKNAVKNNLKNISVDIPTGIFTVITGVAGAGKSSLMEVFLQDKPDAIFVDQSAIKTSSRSITATFIGIMDDIRDLFSEENKVNRSLFSFNSEGACPRCNGLGTLALSLPFMDPINSQCELCQGKRFKEEVLKYTLHRKTISDVLDMTVKEAKAFFNAKSIQEKLIDLETVGLEYLTLGQSLSSFSGGECQRIKISDLLKNKGTIFILDEPTVSLHLADLDKIFTMIDQMVDTGNTVVVIEHNQDVIKRADWVIDIGPEAGTNGGQVIFTGTPLDLLHAENSYTAEFLKDQIK